MPRIAEPSGRAVGALLLLFGSTLLLAGCEGAGSKRASLYQRLTGTWTVERLEGSLISPNRLDKRYAWVRFDFRSGEEGRTYRVTGRLSGDTTLVLAEGPVRLPGNRLLQMVRGFETPNGVPRAVTWTYHFEASRAILRLPSDQRNGARAFLSTLFPTRSWSESQDVRVQLAPSEG